FNKTRYNNCVVRRQVTYTPTSCGCMTTQCDCAQVVQRLRAQAPRVTTTETTTVTETSPSTSASTCSSSPGSSCSSTAGTTTTVTAETPATTATAGTDEQANASVLPISLTGADARALYVRLSKAPEEKKLANGKTTLRAGAQYVCMMDGKGKKDENYACDIDIVQDQGAIVGIYPPKPSALRALKDDAVYRGKNVVCGAEALAMNEATITIQGPAAQRLFRKMIQEAKPGTIDVEQKIQATIKTGSNLKCYTTINTNPVTTECVMKANTDTGEIIANVSVK
ncbi:MAG: hypothetical protein H7333_01060, partial [Bdellovibrionales bacterium]|nr:hypothetical protein [Oligoflexia bacterium]